MLKKLVLEEEEKAGLTSNSISLDTIRTRVKMHNVTAYNPFEEPLLRSRLLLCWPVDWRRNEKRREEEEKPGGEERAENKTAKDREP